MDWLSRNPSILVLVGVFAMASLLENWRPLRRSTQNKKKRWITNLSVAATSAAMLRFSFYPIVMAVAVFAESRQIGLRHVLGWPEAIGFVLSVLVLDWTLYYWHWMLHKIPFLWRFHNVHHVDLDLDSTTALRFHFGELMLSTFYRSAQILVFGISPTTLIFFETMVTSFALFHHSNFRLPLWLEKFLKRFIITPRLHGVHHSTVREETDSNFGTILTVWDRVHSTLKSDVPQDRIKIGVPAYQDPRELGIWGLLALPFGRQRPWP